MRSPLLEALRGVVLLFGLAVVGLAADAELLQPADLESRVTSRAEPVYPMIAKQMRVQGSVVVEVNVESDGSVNSARAVDGNPILAQAAVAAVRRWKFRPVDSGRVLRIPFRFTL